GSGRVRGTAGGRREADAARRARPRTGPSAGETAHRTRRMKSRSDIDLPSADGQVGLHVPDVLGGAGDLDRAVDLLRAGDASSQEHDALACVDGDPQTLDERVL